MFNFTSEQTEITINDYEPHIFKLFLEHLHSNEIESIHPDDIFSLLKLSKNYMQSDLQQLLENHLLTEVSPSTVLEIKEIAEQYELHIVKNGIMPIVLSDKAAYAKLGIFK